MAYRRRQGLSRSSTFKEGTRCPPDHDDATTSSGFLPHRSSNPRLDSFRSGGAFHASFKNRNKGSGVSDQASLRTTNEPGGFWGVLARKAKAILEDDIPQQSSAPSSVKAETIRFLTSNQKSTGIQVQNQNEDVKKLNTPTLGMRLERLTPSLKQIGDTIGNSMEIKRRPMETEENNQDPAKQSAQPQKNKAIQLQASRDVAIATAAKVKQLIRELKSVKAELASTKDRCNQLEEENKLLLGTYEKGDHPADNMIRVQLETLLAEKGRLAHDNSVYALENRYLREIVDFHHLSMQDLVSLDEDLEAKLSRSGSLEKEHIEAKLPRTPSEASLNMAQGSPPCSSRNSVCEE